MTREEFEEKYGDVKVRFSYYYKYTFQFVGVVDEVIISVSVGGGDGEIYRFEVIPNKDYQVKELGINYGSAKTNGKLIDEFIEY